MKQKQNITTGKLEELVEDFVEKEQSFIDDRDNMIKSISNKDVSGFVWFVKVLEKQN